jgi:hypothetical protein
MKFPKKATQIELYVNEMIYQDAKNKTCTWVPPKWFENALQNLWNRAHKQDEEKVKEVLRGLVK